MSKNYEQVERPIKLEKWDDDLERQRNNYSSRRSIMLSTQNQTEKNMVNLFDQPVSENATNRRRKTGAVHKH